MGTELKSLAKPPVQVLHVLGGVAIVLGEPNTEWSTIKKMFKDTKFLNDVRAFDPTTMDARTLNKVKAHVAKEHLDPEKAVKVSKVLPPFMMWLEAVITYGDFHVV